jgi:hypothetical protein
VTHSPYARAPDLSVTLSRIAVQSLTLIFHQHTEAKDVITSKLTLHLLFDNDFCSVTFGIFFVEEQALFVNGFPIIEAL